MSADGVLRFGRYAFPPNQLGYCGPDDHDALRGYVEAGRSDPGLVELGRRFEGAYPYLRLIAESNGIADPFDPRVVEAYWVGNRLLERTAQRGFHESLQERFAPRMTPREFEWLASKIGLGAVPHHNFHVFEVYSRAGLMNGDRSGPFLEVMDSCRISWGRVETVDGGAVVVRRRPLEVVGGRVALGVARPVRLESYAPADLVPGEWVSVHWGWACEALRPGELARLQAATGSALARFNSTL